MRGTDGSKVEGGINRSAEEGIPAHGMQYDFSKNLG
jgi:hypothetical protein